MQPELVKVLGTLASGASARLPGAGTQTDGGDVRVDGPVQLPDLKRTLPTGVEGKVASCVLTSLPRVIAEGDDLWAAPGAAQLQWAGRGQRQSQGAPAPVSRHQLSPKPDTPESAQVCSRHLLLPKPRCAFSGYPLLGYFCR